MGPVNLDQQQGICSGRVGLQQVQRVIKRTAQEALAAGLSGFLFVLFLQRTPKQFQQQMKYIQSLLRPLTK